MLWALVDTTMYDLIGGEMRSAYTTILPNAIAKIDNRIARSYSPAAKLIF